MPKHFPIKDSLNSVGVFYAHGDHAECPSWGCPRVLQDQVNHFIDLSGCAFLLPVARGDFVYMNMPDCLSSAGSREGHESIVIDVVVRKGNERLVPAPVVPIEMKSLDKGDHHI